MTTSIAQRLLDLNITLPKAASPAAAYVMYVRSGHTLYVSGHIAKKAGQPWVGKLGKDMTTEQGKEAARAVAIDLMAKKNWWSRSGNQRGNGGSYADCWLDCSDLQHFRLGIWQIRSSGKNWRHGKNQAL